MNRFFRLNQYITAPEVRLIDQEGKQIGIVSRSEALLKAQVEGVDLVEIASNAKPPVARLIEFKKYKYLLSKKDKGPKAKGGDIKEIRLGPFTNDHDLEPKISKAKRWLSEGNKVRVVVKFSGREITKSEFGRRVIAKVTENLKDFAEVEKPAYFEGRQLVTILKEKK